jgi:uncharacterized protein involved in exopolysaccharide biosynthesis
MPREKPPVDVQITQGGFETGRDIATRGNTGALMLPAEVELYTQLLRSDAVLTRIGARFAPRLGLAEDLGATELVQAIRNRMKISGTENGLITVEATAPHPVVAAELANALVDEMVAASKTAERQLIAPQIDYLRTALGRTRDEAERRARELEAFIEAHGIIDLSRQTQDLLSLIRDTEYVRLGLVQQRIERLQAFTEADHVARGLQQRIEQCDADLADLQRRAVGTTGIGGDDGSGVRQVELQLAALRDDLARSRDLVAVLEDQLAIFEFKLDQPSGAVSKLKPAIPVRQRAGPGKGETLGTALLIAFVLGVALALLREQFGRVGEDPYLAGRAEEIRAHLRLLAPQWMADRLDRSAAAAAPGPPEREAAGSGGRR